MANKTLNTRIQNKRGTSSDWAQATTFKPLEGEVIVYTDINKIKVGDGNTLVGDLPFVEPKGGLAMFGTCATTAGTAAKEVPVSDVSWELKVGAIIGIKFTDTNIATDITLNVNNTGAKNIWYNNAKYTGSDPTVCGTAGRLNYYMYDGTYWCWLNLGTEYDSNTYTSAYCNSKPAVVAKTAYCTNYALLAKSYTQITMATTNTYAGPLTLNINNRGAKPIYINGTASSSSNHTLPAGTYFIYYDGTNYYFRTDGKLTIDGGIAALTSDIPTKVSQLDNDSGFLTQHQLIKSLSTTATSAQTATVEDITGAGLIKLHKISKTGTYSDLIGKPTIPTITLNGSSTTSPSFYAPTTAGTNGYVLTSSGSGVPTWKESSSAPTATQTISGISKLVTGNIALDRTYANGEAAAAAHTHAGYFEKNGSITQTITANVLFYDTTSSGADAELTINSKTFFGKPIRFENQTVSSTFAQLSYSNTDQTSSDPDVQIALPTVSGTLALTSEIPTISKIYEHNIKLACKSSTYYVYVFLRLYHTQATALTVSEVLSLLTTQTREASGFGMANVENLGTYKSVVVTGVSASSNWLYIDICSQSPYTTTAEFGNYSLSYASSSITISDTHIRQVN